MAVATWAECKDRNQNKEEGMPSHEANPPGMHDTQELPELLMQMHMCRMWGATCQRKRKESRAMEALDRPMACKQAS